MKEKCVERFGDRRTKIYGSRGIFSRSKEENFRRRDDKMMKMAELKRIKQESRMMEEFVQKFRRVARESSYER